VEIAVERVEVDRILCAQGRAVDGGVRAMHIGYLVAPDLLASFGVNAVEPASARAEEDRAIPIRGAGVDSRRRRKLPEDLPPLVEGIEAAGFRVVAFVATEEHLVSVDR